MENPICSNPEDYFGNIYNTKSDNLIIIKITPKNFYCLTRKELAWIVNSYTSDSPPAIEQFGDSKVRRENPKF